MISVASTLLLVSLVFGTVPSASAAPIGTRNLDVKSMRRMQAEELTRRVDTRELTGMRRDHHSATSYVPRDDDTPTPVAVVARAGSPEVVKPNPDLTATTSTSPSPSPSPKPKMRRHHAKNEDKGTGTDAKPRALPRFKRDAIPRREHEQQIRSTSTSEPEVVARKEDASSSNVAREDDKVERGLFNGTAAPGGGAKGSTKPDPEPRDVHDPPATSASKRDAGDGSHVGEKMKPSDKAEPDHPKREAPSVKPVESSVPKVAARDDGKCGSGKDCPHKDPSTQNPGTTPPPAKPETKREEVQEAATKREEKKDTKLIKPIAIFRRALAFEDLD
ncbi:hypothetical protein LshimejAT787_0604880 [Lyophyllum shimeji]|uniref:Uncharacterized protein n=1 Tax=Lyophyllum shimeji TaxID=47721 RepID=A0A9P3UQK6_LYOSH|nr:hypothetical protein LshimejAT787_0604880 [Lyophyllum shimeji]